MKSPELIQLKKRLCELDMGRWVKVEVDLLKRRKVDKDFCRNTAIVYHFIVFEQVESQIWRKLLTEHLENTPLSFPCW